MAELIVVVLVTLAVRLLVRVTPLGAVRPLLVVVPSKVSEPVPVLAKLTVPERLSALAMVTAVPLSEIDAPFPAVSVPVPTGPLASRPPATVVLAPGQGCQR